MLQKKWKPELTKLLINGSLRRFVRDVKCKNINPLLRIESGGGQVGAAQLDILKSIDPSFSKRLFAWQDRTDVPNEYLQNFLSNHFREELKSVQFKEFIDVIIYVSVKASGQILSLFTELPK